METEAVRKAMQPWYGDRPLSLAWEPGAPFSIKLHAQAAVLLPRVPIVTSVVRCGAVDGTLNRLAPLFFACVLVSVFVLSLYVLLYLSCVCVLCLLYTISS